MESDNPAMNSAYFDKLEARCHDCRKSTVLTSTIFGSIAVIFALAGTSLSISTRTRKGEKWLKRVRRFRKLWRRAGMPTKLKMLVGVFQCIAAIPSVYNLNTPPGLGNFNRLLLFLEFPADMTNFIVPPACLGKYRRCMKTVF